MRAKMTVVRGRGGEGRAKCEKREKKERERERALLHISPLATESKVSTLKETRVVSPIERHSTCAFVPFLFLPFSS